MHAAEIRLRCCWERDIIGWIRATATRSLPSGCQLGSYKIACNLYRILQLLPLVKHAIIQVRSITSCPRDYLVFLICSDTCHKRLSTAFVSTQIPQNFVRACTQLFYHRLSAHRPRNRRFHIPKHTLNVLNFTFMNKFLVLNCQNKYGIIQEPESPTSNFFMAAIHVPPIFTFFLSVSPLDHFLTKSWPEASFASRLVSPSSALEWWAGSKTRLRPFAFLPKKITCCRWWPCFASGADLWIFTARFHVYILVFTMFRKNVDIFL